MAEQPAQSVQARLLAMKENPEAQITIAATTVPEPIGLQRGEVLFEVTAAAVIVNTALRNGARITFPYVTDDPTIIKELKAFAKHCGLLSITEG